MNDTDKYKEKLLHKQRLLDLWKLAAKLLVAELEKLRKIEQEHGRVIIDDWEHKPNGVALEDAPYAHPEYGQPYVTVYLGGCEYVGLLRLYKNEDGEVIE